MFISLYGFFHPGLLFRSGRQFGTPEYTLKHFSKSKSLKVKKKKFRALKVTKNQISAKIRRFPYILEVLESSKVLVKKVYEKFGQFCPESLKNFEKGSHHSQFRSDSEDFGIHPSA